MSELSSLFLKVSIEKDQLNAFLQAPPEAPQLQQDWISWWESRKMYGKQDLTENQLRSYAEKNNQAIVDMFINYPSSITSSDYDEATETWYFSIVFFSENFFEMLPGIAFMKSIVPFKKNDPTDFGIIYNFFWGDSDISALVDFVDGKALLSDAISKTQLDPQKLELANNYLNKKVEQLNGEED